MPKKQLKPSFKDTTRFQGENILRFAHMCVCETLHGYHIICKCVASFFSRFLDRRREQRAKTKQTEYCED